MQDVIIGSLGLIFILVAFLLDEIHDISNTYYYNIINLVGAVMLLYYSFSLKSTPFIILQSVWGLVALVKIIEMAVFEHQPFNKPRKRTRRVTRSARKRTRKRRKRR